MGYDLYFMGPSMWTMGENRVSTSMTRKWKVLLGLNSLSDEPSGSSKEEMVARGDFCDSRRLPGSKSCDHTRSTRRDIINRLTNDFSDSDTYVNFGFENGTGMRDTSGIVASEHVLTGLFWFGNHLDLCFQRVKRSTRPDSASWLATCLVFK